MTTHALATILYEGVNALDVAGPLEAFAAARHDDGTPCYTLDVWSLGPRDVGTESGLRLRAFRRAPVRPCADLFLLPGGAGVRDPRTLKALGEWLRRHHASFGRIASVCTGAYAIAESGLADGRTLTTHWAHADDLRRRYPKVCVESDALYTQDGTLLSSGGVTAGIDLALSIIEGDFGARIAVAAARELVVFLRRTGTQAQFSEPLRLQAIGDDGLQEVCLWATNHPHADLSVEALARRANMSPRQFARRFRAAFGMPPGRFVVKLRLDWARTALSGGRVSVKRVAHSAGFRSVDGFRRAFERELGVTPSEYQQRFANRRSIV